MRVVLVDAKYFAKYIRGARRQMHINREECARMFGISRRELHKIENGSMLIPENIIQRIMINGMTMLLCKQHTPHTLKSGERKLKETIQMHEVPTT